MKLDGRAVKPWEIKWDNEPDIPTIQIIHWHFLIAALGLPLVAWLLVSVLLPAFRWVRSGFHAGAD